MLVDNPEFMEGLGMRSNIRIKIRGSWSYIHSAALRIGNATLELMGGEEKNNYWLNGKKGNEVKASDSTLSATAFLSGFSVHVCWPFFQATCI